MFCGLATGYLKWSLHHSPFIVDDTQELLFEKHACVVIIGDSSSIEMRA
jgi:hypothetical protein